MHLMTTLSPWNRFPLVVHWLSDKHHHLLAQVEQLPLHMTSQIGTLEDLYIYKNGIFVCAIFEPLLRLRKNSGRRRFDRWKRRPGRRYLYQILKYAHFNLQKQSLNWVRMGTFKLLVIVIFAMNRL
jgi:hypothetical protein